MKITNKLKFFRELGLDLTDIFGEFELNPNVAYK